LPMLGIGGGGGAADGGGGGGGPLGAPLGIGGGGGAELDGIGGGGGGENAPDPGAGLLGSLPAPLPVALNGRGGPIVPKSIDANIFALPAPGFSSSEESSSLSDPATDHSSSSGLTRLIRPPGPVGWVVNGDAADGLVA